VGQVSVVAAVEFRRLAREMRVSGARVLGADAEDRAGVGLLKWADRLEEAAVSQSPRLRVVDDGDAAQAG
jgi:hypothetical protein